MKELSSREERAIETQDEIIGFYVFVGIFFSTILVIGIFAFSLI